MANVTCLEDVIYVEFDEKVLKDLTEKEEYKVDLQKIMMRIEISKFVSSAPLFKDFPSEVMNLFVDLGELAIFPTGTEIVAQNESDRTFYLIIRGKVSVFKDQKKITDLGQGEFFGEVALLNGMKRTATIQTTEETMVLFIEGKNFWRILKDNINLAMYFESVGQQRFLGAA